MATSTMLGIFAIGSVTGLITDVFRVLFLILDGIIYGFIPIVFSLMYSLYDINTILSSSKQGELIKTMSQTIYSFMAVVMFFRIGFSLLTMIVDPSIIGDKEKGAGNIVKNVMMCLILVVVVPYGFRYARLVQSKVIDNHLIEQVIIGEDGYDDPIKIGEELSLQIFGVFVYPNEDTSGSLKSDYDAVFKTKTKPIISLIPYMTSTTSLIPTIFNGIFSGESGSYKLSYVWGISTICGIYVLWVVVKLMIDIAYRSIKFFALELISPIAVVSYIDPSSSKKGIFSKWLNEAMKTYLSLFIRIFVFALVSVMLQNFNLGTEDSNLFVKLFWLLAIIAFIKTAPKFIDNLFGTSVSKDSDTKFASDMFRGALGGFALGTVGGIHGATVAKRMGQSPFKGFLSGGWSGITKGYNAAHKGNIPGVVSAATGTFDATKKKYGFAVDKEHDKEFELMKKHYPVGKKSKADAIAKADANNKKDINDEFNRTGKAARKVNGYDVKYGNLFGDAQAEGAYKAYVSSVAETNSIPGISEEGKKVYGSAALQKMYSTLSNIQSTRANAEYEMRVGAFTQKDSAGKQDDIMDVFNRENARLASLGQATYSDWQTMYKDIGNISSTANISVDDAFKIAVDHEIAVKTGHNTSEWANIAQKDESDAAGAKKEVERYEASNQGKADARKKKIYGEAKSSIEGQNFKGI